VIGFKFAKQDPHQRGFSGTIVAQQPDAVSRLNLTLDSVQQIRAAKANRKV
jgi:hypothetical protein